ncbi:GNAT family N-acetyltransferase [Maribacter sp. 2307ULW6-5]|uniref:GNAT family N-acetyltransferase n=1 Tax=Maribacter sp. 2307ULW6-5 TaxID=3386275 RepID=UPI0039BD30E1
MGAFIDPGHLALRPCTVPPPVWWAALPPDWQGGLTAFLQQAGTEPVCLVLEQAGQCRVAGMVCSGLPADLLPFAEQLGAYGRHGQRYVGYLFALPPFRGQGWAGQWLRLVCRRYPGETLWLTVEEEALVAFYQRNGFRFIQTLEHKGSKEWLLAKPPTMTG